MTSSADGETSRRRVLIIGAGPGGLTAAIALRRVGIEATVFERGAELGRSGAGLGVQSNALRALQRIGVGDRIAAAGIEVRVLEVCDNRGRVLLRYPQGEVADEFGTPTISLLRSDVQTALVDALGDGVLRLGRECVAVDQDADEVTATFADGSVERGGLLIGADGGRSTVRRHVYPDDAPPRYSGFSSWRSVVKMAPDLLPEGASRTYLGYGRQFVTFPVGEDRIYWGLMKPAPEGQTDTPGLQDRLLSDVADFPPVAAQLVQATDPQTILRTDISDRDPDPTWTKGRVVLLGDAAHMTTPFVGQGAGISIEDAVVLAKELSLTDGMRDQSMLGSALDSYENKRVDRCAKIVLASRRRGQIASRSHPALVAARNRLLSSAPDRVWRRSLESMIRFDL